MASKEFKRLEKLFAQINKDASKVLQSQVYNKVVQVEQDTIEEVVYKAYPEPKQYERRRMKSRNGFSGLQSKKSIQKTMLSENTIRIRNVSKDVSEKTGEIRDVAEIVEYGHFGYTQGYEYPTWQVVDPRPFTQKTKDKLRDTKEHVNAMQIGLRAKGYSIQ